ncbi:8543_t:CDS:2 [Funneliformis geosporum]|uniref:8543_t:CDS:1 n=1 Tax=Funneliformis geosporum TaxID=1117311 RepID=A0A9W4WSD0_9GLOM|nr:8543_t:CDS:2 [Funneliformis geosporum]
MDNIPDTRVSISEPDIVQEDEVKSLDEIDTSYDLVAISPNAKYIVQYIHNDKQIVGWNIQDNKEGKLNDTVKPYCVIDKVNKLCVSDENIVAIDPDERFEMIDMKYQDRIGLPEFFNLEYLARSSLSSFNFNSKGEFIITLWVNDNGFSIFIYSKQTKWKCQKIYNPPVGEIILISPKNEIWLRKENYIYEFNTETGNTKMFSKNIHGVKMKDIRISSNDKFTCIKINDEIIVYSNELDILIASLDSNDGMRLYQFMNQHTGSHSSLLSLFDYQLTKDNLLVKENLPLLFFQNHLFVIVNDSVLKIKLELDLDIYSSSEELKIYKDVENWMAYFGSEKVEEKKIINDYEYENPFIPNIKVDPLSDRYFDMESQLNNIYVEAIAKNGIIGLRVHKRISERDKWDLAVEHFQKYKFEEVLTVNEVEIFEKNDIAILTNIGIFIFNLSENDEVTLNYFHYIYYPKKISFDKYFGKKSQLIELSSDYKKLINGWVSYVNDDKIGFYKYGQNNKMFLSIITTLMPLLKTYYPEYLTRYSLDTNLIIDSVEYKVEQDPWEITTIYSNPDQKGLTDPKPSSIQAPDENTNMFSDYGTSLFAIYLFLTGDASALTPWPYKDNKTLNNEWGSDEFSEMNEKLLKILNIQK